MYVNQDITEIRNIKSGKKTTTNIKSDFSYKIILALA